ncbi:predicted protein [Nematostella vectensis]|uniref:SHSP domain-containing protein n=1 Tax=Nematostella vectensis TaxID=45351 RepID=A7RLT4_NEMVE|nr:uncharacterized protein LOC5519939 [Nematostella vectensis]EDO47656.1 predicted protein [Nematostella vectensis]|eukprot:XP_001639719.1 predicted protein [Nematostella vectensis]
MKSLIISSVFLLSLAQTSIASFLVSRLHQRSLNHPFFFPHWDSLSNVFDDPFFRDPFTWSPFDDDSFDTELLPAFHEPRRDELETFTPTFIVTQNDKNGIKLEMNVRGFAAKDVSLQVDGQDLIIKGEKMDKDDGWCKMRQFCWRRRFPKSTDMKSIKATLKYGDILEIEAQKERLIDTSGKIDKVTNADRENHGRDRKSSTEKIPVRVNQKQQREEKKLDEQPETTIEIIPEDLGS